MLTYAIDQGYIEKNPAHGIRKPADRVKDRRLTEHEYRMLGKLLEKNSADEQFQMTVQIIRFLALTGCRRGEAIHLKWEEVDQSGSCIRLIDSKEGKSVRAIGLPVVDLLNSQRIEKEGGFVFQGKTQIDHELASEVSRELREIDGKAGKYAECKVAAEDQLRRIDIRAPISGAVHELNVHTVGGVISAGEQLMLIVPASERLSVEARISPQDIDQVRVGQIAQ